MQGFAELDPAAGERIEALARRAGAANQEDFSIAENRTADGELGTDRLDKGGQRNIR
jgi:hypothetical protein